MTRIKRHKFNEAHLHVMLAREGSKVGDFVFVVTTHDDGIDFDRLADRLAFAAAIPASTRSRTSTPVICLNTSRFKLSRLIVMRSSPASFKPWARSGRK